MEWATTRSENDRQLASNIDGVGQSEPSGIAASPTVSQNLKAKTAAPGSIYRGRFAPSPTGQLHFGSLVAAVGSYLQAKVAAGEWLVRIEDLDPPRTVPGAIDEILSALATYGFEWQGEIHYQSQRGALYETALDALCRDQRTYECSCSRAEIEADSASSASPDGELRYFGKCKQGPLHPHRSKAVRFRVPEEPVAFIDGLQGKVELHLPTSIGDFVLKRRDGLFAYQLAVVVDDHAQGITEVVRGADLLLNTPRQIALQRALGVPTPNYFHLPLVIDAQGNKLSKSTSAAPLDLTRPSAALWQALEFLRQSPPRDLAGARPSDVWSWALAHWTPEKMRGVAAGEAPRF